MTQISETKASLKDAVLDHLVAEHLVGQVRVHVDEREDALEMAANEAERQVARLQLQAAQRAMNRVLDEQKTTQRAVTAATRAYFDAAKPSLESKT